jgi:DNA-binding protein HU-beta
MGSHFCGTVLSPSPATRSQRTTCGDTCIFGAYQVKLMFTELRFRESKAIAMTKADLLAAVAAKTNVSSAEADRVIQAFVDLVVDSASKGDKVSWPGFGSFSTSKRQARTGRNPRTGEPVQIAASTAMKFSPSSTLKAALNPNR